jgi:hypothetical protein
MKAIILPFFLVALASPALAGPMTRCTTYEEQTMGRLQTVCDDGTRAVSTWSPKLQQWQTTITESPKQTCTGRLTPFTKQLELRCRWLTQKAPDDYGRGLTVTTTAKGNPTCDHPDYGREYFGGTHTGDYACTQCGAYVNPARFKGDRQPPSQS